MANYPHPLVKDKDAEGIKFYRQQIISEALENRNYQEAKRQVDMLANDNAAINRLNKTANERRLWINGKRPN